MRDTLGEDAYERQEEYMKTEVKPNEMTMMNWLKRLEYINTQKSNLKQGVFSWMLAELNKNCISKTLPTRIRIDYIKQGGKRLTSKAEIKTLLKTLEEAYTLWKGINNKRNNKKKN